MTELVEEMVAAINQNTEDHTDTKELLLTLVEYVEVTEERMKAMENCIRMINNHLFAPDSPDDEPPKKPKLTIVH